MPVPPAIPGAARFLPLFFNGVAMTFFGRLKWRVTDEIIKSLTTRSAFPRLIEFAAVRCNYSLPRTTSEEPDPEA